MGNKLDITWYNANNSIIWWRILIPINTCVITTLYERVICIRRLVTLHYSNWNIDHLVPWFSPLETSTGFKRISHCQLWFGEGILLGMGYHPHCIVAVPKKNTSSQVAHSSHQDEIHRTISHEKSNSSHAMKKLQPRMKFKNTTYSCILHEFPSNSHLFNPIQIS